MAELRYCLRGEVDVSNAIRIQETLNAVTRKSGAGLVVDCSELVFIDSAGMAALLRIQRMLANDGRGFRMTNASPMLRSTCDRMGVTYLLRLSDVEPTITDRRT